jgi:FMN phosphatase YigB (HAD superfamily)
MINSVKYLLFDLDGTLIDFDLKTFIEKYLRLIQANFSHLQYARSVPEWILEGTSVMLTSVESITNKNKFLRYFQDKTKMSEDQIWEIFLQFYQTDYDKLKEITRPVSGAGEFLASAVAQDFNLVLATQPVFPEIAIRKRLLWAGLEKIPFKLVTHIDNMYASKPHKQYYEQILNMLGTTGDTCLMIGNDIEMDMAAKDSGIHTFYLQTHSQNAEPEVKNADFRGDFKLLSKILSIFPGFPLSPR